MHWSQELVFRQLLYDEALEDNGVRFQRLDTAAQLEVDAHPLGSLRQRLMV